MKTDLDRKAIRYSTPEEKRIIIKRLADLGITEGPHNPAFPSTSNDCIFVSYDHWSDQKTQGFSSRDVLDFDEFCSLGAKPQSSKPVELKPLLDKLEKDAKETRKKIRFLEREQLRARTSIYSALRMAASYSASFCESKAKSEVTDLFFEDLAFEEKKLESIEKHIEELTKNEGV